MKRACSMSKEKAMLESSFPLQSGAADQRDTAGTLLREGRKAQNLDIAALAAMLKVSVHKLQALEQDQSELLADPVFARALASSMCRILKLDPVPVLQQLPSSGIYYVTSQDRGINASFQIRNGRNEAPLWSHISRPAVLVGLALLLGTLILMLLPSIQQAIASYRQNDLSESSPSQAAEFVSVKATLTALINSIFPAPSGPATISHPAPRATSPVDVSVASLRMATPPVAIPAAVMETSSTDPAVTFNARRASNIKVTNADGLVVFDRVLQARESASLSGKSPLAVVITRANAIQVQVRGQDFDLAGATQSNIARFEVK